MEKKVIIAYATNRGNARTVAEKIAELIKGSTVVNIAETPVTVLSGYDYLILGTSTIGNGDILKPWKEKMDELSAIDFKDKTVALFGLGNQAYHGNTFAEGISHLYDALAGKVSIEGFTSIDGFKFAESKSEVDGKFVGLILDMDVEAEKADAKIEAWVKSLSL
ncbi:MAG: flavodoxin domain-containing protein [Paludibacter sp.]